MKLNSIDFNKIAVFCEIIDSGNYQRAADVLLVTPSALSQTISSLEHSLGLALFDRRGRKLIPTKDGLRIHQEFRLSRDSLRRTLNELTERQTDVSGTLRVGAYLEFAKSKMTRLLNRFMEEHPKATIKLVFDSPSRLHRLLNDGQLDLCLSIFPSTEKKTIRSQVLCEEELVLIAPPHLLTSHLTLSHILETPIIDYYFNHQVINRWVSLHFNKRPKNLPVRIFAASAEMVVALVREGSGVGVVPKYLVVSPENHSDTKADLFQGLKIVRPTSKKLTDYIWLLENVASERSAVHTAFSLRVAREFSTEFSSEFRKTAPDAVARRRSTQRRSV